MSAVTGPWRTAASHDPLAADGHALCLFRFAAPWEALRHDGSTVRTRLLNDHPEGRRALVEIRDSETVACRRWPMRYEVPRKLFPVQEPRPARDARHPASAPEFVECWCLPAAEAVTRWRDAEYPPASR